MLMVIQSLVGGTLDFVPVIKLKPDTKIDRGMGTEDNPYELIL